MKLWSDINIWSVGAKVGIREQCKLVSARFGCLETNGLLEMARLLFELKKFGHVELTAATLNCMTR